MEINVAGGGRGRISRDTSPDRARINSFASQKQKELRTSSAARRVQVVYYLSRNGQLDHPHFMEISHLPQQRLRLKDVLDRLTLLRGRGMPSLFSWSCKRSYKNGYVWNDLSENDVIYPADGAEYVLKGSELIHAPAPPPHLDRFQHLQLGTEHPRPLPPISMAAEEGEDVEEDDELGGNLTASVEPHRMRCSRGVSTDEIERRRHHHHHHQKGKPAVSCDAPANHSGRTEIALDDSSPPSSSSSDKASAAAGGVRTGCASFLFEDSEPAAESGHIRNSVLLQLISCGSIAVKGGRTTAGRGLGGLWKSAIAAPADVSASGRKSGISTAAAAAAAAELQCMSENPRRLGNPLMEDKQYFSGSIVEATAVSDRAAADPALKKSSSYNEER
ncbi:hypothetical protein KSP39_PZI010308 [Platanthera zijinensis]|uniref:SOSEKI DIX-like domain-containing protein n=1 Tax=Platanthera zijinensis TaxID=2320716 RepID=A0AAP0BJ96_9ASPA